MSDSWYGKKVDGSAKWQGVRIILANKDQSVKKKICQKKLNNLNKISVGQQCCILYIIFWICYVKERPSHVRPRPSPERPRPEKTRSGRSSPWQMTSEQPWPVREAPLRWGYESPLRVRKGVNVAWSGLDGFGYPYSVLQVAIDPNTKTSFWPFIKLSFPRTFQA